MAGNKKSKPRLLSKGNESSPRNADIPSGEALPQQHSANENGVACRGIGSVPPVVGLVASAGGLKAFRDFFSAMPGDNRMAFVVVPHLDPSHPSEMASLLARYTAMPVVDATEGCRLAANHVYVIPASHHLRLRRGVVQLNQPSDIHEVAIDTFLYSLADDQQEHAICVILSGTGSHGTQGLKAIKAGGGLVMVQEPASAEYDQMPRSAIESGLADYVLAPEQMPEALLQYVQRFITEPDVADGADMEDKELPQLLAMLRERMHFDFRAYRQRMLRRRIRRRMGIHRLDSFDEYLTLLRQQPEEVERLCRDLLIRVTSFFRDPEMFRVLENEVLPDLVMVRGADAPVRVWVPGCATGEEPYSIAMLLLERLDAAGYKGGVKVFATDVDESALKLARRGIYPDTVVAEIGPARLARFFTKVDAHNWQVGKQLREAVLFAPHNLLVDPPFHRLDLVSCRNLLIYLTPPAQHQLLRLFHFALRSDGYLVLGPSESIDRKEDGFLPVSKKWRIFRKTASARSANDTFTAQTERHEQHYAAPEPRLPSQTLTEVVQKMLLQNYAPAAVVINEDYEVLYYSGPTHSYLRQPDGAPCHNLLALAGSELRPRLRTTVHKTLQKQRRVNSRGIHIERGGRNIRLGISAQPLHGPRAVEGLLLVTFHDEHESPGQGRGATRQRSNNEVLVRQLEYEVETTREELHTAIEELESSNEELRASNEEVRSMNEELQSTIEELETAKEEQRGLNEELTQVNARLNHKVEELETARSAMANLLANVDIATLFLGADRTIRSFTPAADRLFNLIAGDIGRPITDITACIEDPHLVRDVDLVLQHLAPCERELSAGKGQWYLRRITPQWSTDKRVEGVVISYADVTPIKQAEMRMHDMTAQLERQVEERTEMLRQERNFVDAVLDNLPTPVLVVDNAWRIVRCNKACEAASGYTVQDLQGTTRWRELIPPEERQDLEQLMAALAAGQGNLQHENHWIHRDGSKRLFCWHNTVLRDAEGRIQYIIGSGLDVTEQRRAEEGDRQHLEQAARVQCLQTANEVATLLAHEISQPLTAIAMFAEAGQQLLRHNAPDQDKVTENLQRIARQALRGGEIIRRLRSFVSQARIDAAPVDMNAVVKSAIALIRPKAKECNVRLKPDLYEALPPVMGVEVHLEQVLLNLLRNAIEAIHDARMGGGHVSIVTRRVDHMARVTVRDNGPGIDSKTAARLFDPLFSTKDYGLGVGLRISRGLIDAHGGRLWAEPRTPGGIFHFEVPLAQ